MAEKKTEKNAKNGEKKHLDGRNFKAVIKAVSVKKFRQKLQDSVLRLHEKLEYFWIILEKKGAWPKN